MLGIFVFKDPTQKGMNINSNFKRRNFSGLLTLIRSTTLSPLPDGRQASLRVEREKRESHNKLIIK